LVFGVLIRRPTHPLDDRQRYLPTSTDSPRAGCAQQWSAEETIFSAIDTVAIFHTSLLTSSEGSGAGWIGMVVVDEIGIGTRMKDRLVSTFSVHIYGGIDHGGVSGTSRVAFACRDVALAYAWALEDEAAGVCVVSTLVEPSSGLSTPPRLIYVRGDVGASDRQRTILH
jgi:hypothetical protein